MSAKCFSQEKLHQSGEQFKEGYVLVFNELFLKSRGVHKNFKNLLIRNINQALSQEGIDFKTHPLRTRIFIATEQKQEALEVLKNIFGLIGISEGYFFQKAGLKDLVRFVERNYEDWINKKESFALRIKRSPSVKESGQEIIKAAAKNIDRKVNLDSPDKEIFIEAREEGWLLYFDKQSGAGGLPYGCQGKVLSLLSGGIDSPVASYLMAKRGAETVWVHFHSYPLVSQASIEKVKDLAQIFLKFVPRLKVYFVPFSEIQKEIKINVLANYRVLFYRKMMFKLAQKIAQKEGCQALVTGDSLGQVSSQTLPNINIVQDGIKMPIFRPLISTDKEEIKEYAGKIGTYNISIKPQEDCCTLFVSKHQTAEGKIDVFKALERKLKLSKLMIKALKKAEIKIFS